jgi:Flp pilus assembly protein TadG
MNTKRRQSGVAAVELALLAVPLVAMLFGITELGRAAYSYDTLSKAARTAARYLSAHNAGDLTAITQAKCLAVYGTLDCSGTELAPGLTTAMVDVCDATDASLCPGQTHASAPSCYGGSCSGVVNLVTVRITAYPFQSLATYFVPDMNFGSTASSTGIGVTMRQDI